MRTTSLLAALLACSSPAAAARPVAPKVALRARPFPLCRVRLLESPFRRAMEREIRYLLTLDPNRLLWPFYERAGLPTKGDRYGGWERKDCVGHIAGHYLSACALGFAATGEAALKRRVDYMVEEIARVQAKHGDGYTGPVRREVWETTFAGNIKVGAWGLGGGYVPWYVLHKTFAGLIDAYVHAGSRRALAVACGLADWAKRGTDRLSDGQFQQMLRCEHGGMNEALANLYALTGKADYLALARRFDHKQIFEPLAARRDELTGKHVNTQLPKIIGAARLFELTGERRYGTIAEFFWQRAVRERSFAPGGVDYHEHFRAPGEEAKFLNWDSCETCVVYNMLKLTAHLFARAGDAELMDYYERALYNHILGSQDPATGGVTYFYSLKPGHFKIYSTPFDSMWCCVGTGMENHVRYGQAVYARDDESLWVNLFIPSRLEWPERGAVVRQETDFPRRETTTLTLSLKAPQPFALRIRMPRWLAARPTVRVNGEALDLAARPGGYLAVRRTWHDGDRVEVRLPMALHLRPARDDPKLAALMYGPIVLAGELGTEGMPEVLTCPDNRRYSGDPVPEVPVLVAESTDPAAWVRRADVKRLTFRTVGVGRPRDVSLIPLHEMHHQRYTVYWRLLTKADWAKEQAAREAEKRRLAELAARTVDFVEPVPASERAHNQQGKTSYSGAAFGRRWRDARGGGWFSYELKALPDVPLRLMVTYWGSDWGNRVFDILIDGRKIATQKVHNLKPGRFLDVTYDIPAELTGGRTKMTVKFQAHPGAIAGGIFGCRVVKAGK